MSKHPQNTMKIHLVIFLINYLFLERGKRKEKEERNIDVWLPLSCPLLGNRAPIPGMCPDWESNW